MHVKIVQQPGDVAVAGGCDVVELVERLDDARACAACVIRAMRHADDLEERLVVTFEQLDGGQSDRMLPEVRRYIRNPQLVDLGGGRVDEGRLGDRCINSNAISGGIQPHRRVELDR